VPIVKIVQAWNDRIRQKQAPAPQDLYVAENRPTGRKSTDESVVVSAAGEFNSIGDHCHSSIPFASVGSLLTGRHA
jgi:hypothetical protein